MTVTKHSTGQLSRTRIVAGSLIVFSLVLSACAATTDANRIDRVSSPESTQQSLGLPELPTTVFVVPSTVPAPPQVRYAGLTYDCDRETTSGWECSRGYEVVYCDGFEGPTDCSDMWYPSSLSHVDLVEWGTSSYVCISDECEIYEGGAPPPLRISNPDIWCDNQSCGEYDPDRYFEVYHSSGRYICDKVFGSGWHFDCTSYFGGAPPSFIYPQLYCSGSEYYPDCSDLWYPDEMDRADILEFNGQMYVCDRAFSGSFGDYDCGVYTGGDPRYVSTGWGLKCTKTIGWDCRTDFYPSELEGLSFATISGGQYVCKNSYGGSECWSYWSGSPKSATGGLPDYYCNYSGCSRDGYP